jgi:hypothetical protein
MHSLDGLRSGTWAGLAEGDLNVNEIALVARRFCHASEGTGRSSHCIFSRNGARAMLQKKHSS